jgi:hypothetical protein
MKHLKTFNEAITWNPDEFKQELKEFCEMNLAYLLDDIANLYVTISFTDNWDEYSTSVEDFHKIVLSFSRNPKQWDEIKDHIIPFLTRLNREYEVKSLYLDTTLRYDSKYKIEDLINDKLSFDSTTSIYEIYLYVEDYKQEKPKGFISKVKSFFK